MRKSKRNLRNTEIYRYLDFCNKTLFWFGKERRKKIEYKKLCSIFCNNQGTTVSIKDIVIPIPELQDINSWNYELVDLVAPYAFYDLYDYGYKELEKGFFEGPYEISDKISIKAGDVVIDCGANAGFFSAVASAKGASIVYAFEPLQIVIDKYLSITASSNSNITIVNYAVSDQVGETNFVIDPSNVGGSKIGESIQDYKSVVVKLTTLDEFVKANSIERVDFIKCDIEGAERSMLRGASWVLKTMQPKLSICTYHYPEDPKLLESIIKDANPAYIIEHRYKKLYAYVNKDSI